VNFRRPGAAAIWPMLHRHPAASTRTSGEIKTQAHPALGKGTALGRASNPNLLGVAL